MKKELHFPPHNTLSLNSPEHAMRCVSRSQKGCVPTQWGGCPSAPRHHGPPLNPIPADPAPTFWCNPGHPNALGPTASGQNGVEVKCLIVFGMKEVLYKLGQMSKNINNVFFWPPPNSNPFDWHGANYPKVSFWTEKISFGGIPNSSSNLCSQILLSEICWNLT